MAKSDSQNEKFIYYLKNFGPWQGSSNQQAENNAINGSIKNLGGYCTTIINILIENYTKLTFRRGNRSMASMR